MVRLIEDYAFLSDLETAALVHRRGSIDWCCFPRFDSDACLAALLGNDEHGRWRVAPAVDGGPTRTYHHGSLVLDTRWRTSEGQIRVLDFMPPRHGAPTIVRIVEGLSGRVPVRSDLAIRFGYGRIVPWVTHMDGAFVASAGADALCLRTPAENRGENRSIVSTFTVAAGQRVSFTLTWYPSYGEVPVVDPDQAMRLTQQFWTAWSTRCTYDGPYRDEVLQSLVVLKGLTNLPTGGIVAAATTSLPEWPGGVRNWDYRYCWLRDATLTLLAFIKAGYIEEAEQWRTWLLRAAAGDPDNLQIMYGVAGERRLPEWTAEWLPGFEKSRPVRIGNAAAEQHQIDVYGEVTDALYHARKHNLGGSLPAWEFGRHMLGVLERRWRDARHDGAPRRGLAGPIRGAAHAKLGQRRRARLLRPLPASKRHPRCRHDRDAVRRGLHERGPERCRRRATACVLLPRCRNGRSYSMGMGVRALRLTELAETWLDDSYVLVHSRWAADLRNPFRAPLALSSSFILRREGESLAVVFHLNIRTSCRSPVPARMTCRGRRSTR